jgi:hypothetical protein
MVDGSTVNERDESLIIFAMLFLRESNRFYSNASVGMCEIMKKLLNNWSFQGERHDVQSHLSDAVKSHIT